MDILSLAHSRIYVQTLNPVKYELEHNMSSYISVVRAHKRREEWYHILARKTTEQTPCEWEYDWLDVINIPV